MELNLNHNSIKYFPVSSANIRNLDSFEVAWGCAPSLFQFDEVQALFLVPNDSSSLPTLMIPLSINPRFIILKGRKINVGPNDGLAP